MLKMDLISLDPRYGANAPAAPVRFNSEQGDFYGMGEVRIM